MTYLKLMGVFVCCFLLSALLVPSNLSATHAENKSISKKIVRNSHSIYILHQDFNKVEIYALNNTKSKEFACTLPTNSSSMPVDIQCDEAYIYILDQKMNTVLIFDLMGTFVQTIPHIDIFLQHPTTFLCRNDLFYIADMNVIYEVDREGMIRDQYTLLPTLDHTPIITHLDYQDSLVCVVENQQIFVFQSVSHTYSPLAQFGAETGHFLSISTLAFDGNGYVFDAEKKSFFVYHSHLHTWEVLSQIITQEVSDCVLYQGTLYMVNRGSSGFFTFSLQSLQLASPYLLSTREIDFQAVADLDPVERLYLWNPAGTPLRGTLESNHKGIRVLPESFDTNALTISVYIDKKQFISTSFVQESITLHIDGQSSVEIPVKGYLTKTKPNFVLINTPATIDLQESSLSFQIQTSDGFEDTLGVTVINPNDRFVIHTSDILVKQGIQPYTVSFSPSLTLKPGYYPVELRITSEKYKMIKQYSFTVCYPQIPNHIQKTALGELFTAPWCSYCPSAERAMGEIHKTLSAQDICFVNYFIECVKEEQLCTPQTEARKLWYEVSSTPVMIFNGTKTVVGGIRSKTESMIHEYMPVIEPLLSQQTDLSLTGWAYPSDDESVAGNVCVIVSLSSQQPLPTGCVLHTLLVENHVNRPIKSKNEDGEEILIDRIYDYVFRNMTSTPCELLDEEECKNETYSCTFTSEIPVQDYVNLTNCLVVSFVQNTLTKEIIQSRTIPISEITEEEASPILISLKKTIYFSKNNPFFSYYQLYNLETVPQTYKIQWHTSHASSTEPISLVIQDKVLSSHEITLLPQQSLSFALTGEVAVSEDGAGLQVEVQSKNETVNTFQPLVEETQLFYAKILYPVVRETVADTIVVKIVATPGTQLFSSHQELLASVDQIGYASVKVPLLLGANVFSFFAHFSDGTEQEIKYSLTRFIDIVLTIGNQIAYVNGKAVRLDEAAFISEGRTLVPLRFVSEALGASIIWESTTQEIHIGFGEHSLLLQINNKNAYMDGKIIVLDAPPMIKGGRTFVPLRFISEAFGFHVLWNQKTREVTITNKSADEED